MPNVDWNQVLAETRETTRMVNPRRRVVVCFLGFVLVAGTILAKAVWLEMNEGPKRREIAARPLENRQTLPAKRGTIVDRNGVVLAEDRAISSLAVQYRYLETPPNERWLRSLARSRLTKEQRKNLHLVEVEERKVREEQLEVRTRLAELCGISLTEWECRADRVQNEVERISRSVNLRRMAKFRERQRQKAENPPSRFEQFIWPETEQRPEPVTVREELDYHVIVHDVSPEVVRLIESEPEKFSGVKIVETSRRTYPLGSVAAHVLGYLGVRETGNVLVGKAGFEQVFDESLQGQPGEQLETSDQSGRVLSVETLREPQDGKTLRLTIDSRLQQATEELLDRALIRRSYTGAQPEHVGGAAVVMDAQTGEILAAASAPRFDPNWFLPETENRSEKIEQAMTGPSKAMFNRVTQMALPPGSVFKVITAVAALESGVVDPSTVYRCRGFMETEDAYRCQVYQRHQEGHGPIRLTDALAQSCNTYFFNVADQLGAEPILAWAVRFGLGQKTRIELLGESSGELPPLVSTQIDDSSKNRPINPRFVAIGQERLRTTPLQIARMTGVIASQGRLLHPHLVKNAQDFPPTGENLYKRPTADSDESTASGEPIPQLHPETITVIRRGLEATVTSPQGTAYDMHTDSEPNPEEERNSNGDDPATDPIPIAGKTGTAQSGGNSSDHAWFAAYAPADTPHYVVVVALEHAGNASESAVPVARRIFAKMRQLGLLD